MDEHPRRIRHPEGFAPGDSTILTGESRQGRIAFKGGPLTRFTGLPVQFIVHMRRGARLFGMGMM